MKRPATIETLGGVAPMLALAALLIPCAASAQEPGPGDHPAALLAQGGPPAAAAPEPAAPAKPARHFTFGGSWRDRQEVWDWFGSPGGKDRYTFNGSILRLSGSYSDRADDFYLELAAPMLLGLPRDATLPAPRGQLGQGASYRDASAPQEVSLFVKQAYWRVKSPGGASNSARLGRFEFSDGLETTPKDPSLGWLKRDRISQRLLGPFGFTHVGRSFDGGQFVHNTPGLNLTLFGGMPTEGVFDIDGSSTLSGIKVGYAAATHPWSSGRFTGEARLFGLHYLDERKGVVKVDNRPGPVRAADTEDVSVSTVGGHLLGVWNTSGGKLDGLLWGAGQFGSFGSLDQRAYAFAAEVGYQPRGMAWSPWLRAGYSHASGDDDPADGTRGTFFPVLPTPRIYARFPFYTMANLNDAFVQAIVKPHPRWTLRSDVHALWLAEENDLWYVGGGAFQNETFGYGGRPANGKTGLATLLDLSADYQWRKDTSFTAYFGYAFAGDVIDRIYKRGGNGAFGYVELTRRF